MQRISAYISLMLSYTPSATTCNDLYYNEDSHSLPCVFEASIQVPMNIPCRLTLQQILGHPQCAVRLRALLQGYALNEGNAAFLPQFCATIGGPIWLVYTVSSLTLLNAAVVRTHPLTLALLILALLLIVIGLRNPCHPLYSWSILSFGIYLENIGMILELVLSYH